MQQGRMADALSPFDKGEEGGFLIEGMRGKKPSGEKVRSTDWRVINTQLQRSVLTHYPSHLTSHHLRLLLMDPRYQPAGMTTGLRLASPTGSMVSDAVRQLISRFLQLTPPPIC
jgi:hypothetical protein